MTSPDVTACDGGAGLCTCALKHCPYSLWDPQTASPSGVLTAEVVPKGSEPGPYYSRDYIAGVLSGTNTAGH